MVPVSIDGEAVRLAMRVYQPHGAGPFPTLVFNHGSTGSGRDPARFARPIDFPELAQFFVNRGWAVVLPARRGRGGSEGEYDEGFEFNRAQGYACDASRAIPGADRALRDIHAAMGTIRDMPFVDGERLAIGGQSRGGILSVAYAGEHPAGLKAVINFVGAGRARFGAAPTSTRPCSAAAARTAGTRCGSTARAIPTTRSRTAGRTLAPSKRRAAPARSSSSCRRPASTATRSCSIRLCGHPPSRIISGASGCRPRPRRLDRGPLGL